MKIVQATWVRYHHFDLAREINKIGHLERIFTCLPWWKATLESLGNNIPRNKISCNFAMQGLRRVLAKTTQGSDFIDSNLAVLETKLYSKWVARNLPECDAFIGLSGSGLHAGRLAKKRGGIYVMDRGSTQIRYANNILKDEYQRWKIPYYPVHPWLIENEEEEAHEADLITVPSNIVRDSFVQMGTPFEKLAVVPYGVSLSEFYPVKDIVKSGFKLLFVGQFSLRKGAPYLLEAFNKLNVKSKKLTVVGSVANDIKPLLAKMPKANVEFVGAVSRDEVKNYMSQAHALVLPSIEEGLALVQAQALACGCPVIATPNTGSENLFVNDCEGYIVPPRDAVALLTAFEKLATCPETQKRMSRASLSRALLLGGWSMYAEEIIRHISYLSKK